MGKNNIVLLHGALGAKSQFDELALALSHEFQVHSLNFSGHGGRSIENLFSIDQFSSDLHKFLIEESIESTAVFGYSMGGYVALNLCKDQPERFTQIITLGTKFDWTLESASKEVKMLNPKKIEQKIPHFAKHLENLHAPLDWKAVMTNTASMMLDLGNGQALTQQDLSVINVPTIIYRGSLDNMVGSEESEWASNALNNGEFRLVKGVQHPLEKIEVEVLTDLIRSALKVG